MSTYCPTQSEVERLREEIATTYDRVARQPDDRFHFNIGLDYACELLRYRRDELESLPAMAPARFAGLGNPHRIGDIAPGETVLDVGSGGGMDLLLAARRVGPRGRAIGVDPTPAMRERALEAAALDGVADRVEVRDGTAESLPVGDGEVDVVISNGVLNLSHDKRRAFEEIRRVLRPGGRLYLADVVLQEALRLESQSDIELWAG
ncbi:MAG: methyltransferase domain-containing protein [Candidatus Eiseniibacteriota bacterium]|jgi:SAM-dependent methyltransferase